MSMLLGNGSVFRIGAFRFGVEFLTQTWLHRLMDRVSDLGIFGPNRANHVLINEYEPGQGIMPHHDGALYYPVVATVNLGGHSVLDFYKPITTETSNASLFARYVGSALLMPRSLNMVTESLYTYFMHGIEEREIDYLPQIKGGSKSSTHVESDSQIEKRLFNLPQIPDLEDLSYLLERKKRISITIRYVPRTRNIGILRTSRTTQRHDHRGWNPRWPEIIFPI
ncbi:hypothetical protein TcWFU_008822 [Taenia crassiceps]|uniref:Fe2OG dioxygenase domain-containing protein n=1 Tax=Taenia crassiceps TaxID=6207 RepID=A0ABR4QTL2_9CEST